MTRLHNCNQKKTVRTILHIEKRRLNCPDASIAERDGKTRHEILFSPVEYAKTTVILHISAEQLTLGGSKLFTKSVKHNKRDTRSASDIKQ